MHVKKQTVAQTVIPATDEQLRQVDAYWRAANYLGAAQIYLRDNPLLHDDLTAADIKPRLLGHWGTSPGLAFVHAHLNRLIKANDLDVITVLGPGHGGPAALGAEHSGALSYRLAQTKARQHAT